MDRSRNVKSKTGTAARNSGRPSPPENLCRSKRRNTRGSLPPYNPVVISFHVTSYRLSNLPCETIVRIEIRQRKRVHLSSRISLIPVFKKVTTQDPFDHNWANIVSLKLCNNLLLIIIWQCFGASSFLLLINFNFEFAWNLNIVLSYLNIWIILLN